ncbi:tyrosine-protein phosphatase [Corynebacterium sp. 335C]
MTSRPRDRRRPAAIVAAGFFSAAALTLPVAASPAAADPAVPAPGSATAPGSALPGSADAGSAGLADAVFAAPDPEFVDVAPAGSGPIASGALATTPNFRDVAGTAEAPLRTADGRELARGVAYRSNKLVSSTDDELARMPGAGVTRVVDTRNIRERNEEPERLPAGVAYQVADVVDVSRGVRFDESPLRTAGPTLAEETPRILGDVATADPGARGELFDDEVRDLGQLLGYQLMAVNSSSQRAFSELLHAIAHEDGAVVFRYSAGKDRTGLAAAYLLRILGVPMDDIMADFLASDAYLGRENPLRAEWLQASWDVIDRVYGGFDSYVVNQLGLDDADVAALEAKFLRS